MILSDFHTHTSFCDGKNTPQQMAKTAYDMGLCSIGFSGHGYTEFDTSYCMSKQNTQLYIEQVRVLKDKYAGKMDVFLGLEADLYSEFDRSQFDYIIGSVHYIDVDGVKIDIDNPAKILQDEANRWFNCDIIALCEKYFEVVSQIENADIVGHFDLITKYCERSPGLIDQSLKCYRTAAFSALDTLIARRMIFEVNTGAILRGLRTTPYPARFILEYLHERGADIILSGDAHDTKSICGGFKDAIQLLSAVGFDKVTTLTKNGFEYVRI